VKTNEAITPAAALAWGALLVPTATPTHGSGVPAAKRMRVDQDATNGFLAWSPPV
jgi:hypothetical protein